MEKKGEGGNVLEDPPMYYGGPPKMELKTKEEDQKMRTKKYSRPSKIINVYT